MPLEPSAFFKHILCFDTYIFKRYKNRIVYFNKFIKKAKKKKRRLSLFHFSANGDRKGDQDDSPSECTLQANRVPA